MKAFKLLSVLVTALLAAAVFSGCPISGAPEPPQGPIQLGVTDTSCIMVSNGNQIVSQGIPLPKGNFPNIIIAGDGGGCTMPSGLRYWFLPRGVWSDGTQAPTEFSSARVRYQTNYGFAPEFSFHVEPAEDGSGRWNIIGNGEMVANLTQTAAGLWILGGVTLDLVECNIFGIYLMMWPVGCAPGPFKSQAEALDWVISNGRPVFHSDGANLKSLAVRPGGAIEIVPSDNLFFIDIEAEFYLLDNLGNRIPKTWAGRLSFDSDGDGFLNEEEDLAGTDQCDPNSKPGVPTPGAPTVTIVSPTDGATFPVGQAVTFTAQTTGNGASVIWTFPGGSQLEGLSVSKTFAQPVTGVVTAIATSAYGSDVDTIDITIQSVGPTPLSAKIVLPIVITMSQYSNPPTIQAVQGVPIEFEVEATGGNPPYAYDWHFGDGDFKPFRKFFKTFFSLGQGDGNVTVTDSSGAEVSVFFKDQTVAP